MISFPFDFSDYLVYVFENSRIVIKRGGIGVRLGCWTEVFCDNLIDCVSI